MSYLKASGELADQIKFVERMRDEFVKRNLSTRYIDTVLEMITGDVEPDTEELVMMLKLAIQEVKDISSANGESLNN